MTDGLFYLVKIYLKIYITFFIFYFFCYFLALMVIPAIFMVLSLPFCPESPKHLLINQGKEVQAQKGFIIFNFVKYAKNRIFFFK